MLKRSPVALIGVLMLYESCLVRKVPHTHPKKTHAHAGVVSVDPTKLNSKLHHCTSPRLER